MSRRSFGLVLVSVSLVSLGAYLWLSGDGSSRPAASVDDTDSASTSVADLAGPGPDSADAELSQPEPDEARAADAPVIPKLTGRLVWAQATPADERAFVVLVAGERRLRAEVAESGAFEFELPSDLLDGVLGLEARYLYLERATRWKRSEGLEVELRPEVGARIAVDVTFPASVSPEARRLTSIRAIGDQIGDDLIVEGEFQPGETTYLNALRTDRKWDVSAQHPDLYDEERGSFSLERAQLLNVSIPFTVGTSFVGQVRFEDGRPAAGIEVEARSLSDTGYYGVDRAQVEADDEGRFEFRGQRPGLYAILAQADDRASARVDTNRLADGERQEGIELVLRSGERIAGYVTWPDGSAAVGARVRASAQYRAGNRIREFETDSTGAFEGSVLGKAPYRVWASAESELDGSVHRALATGVPSGALDLTLVLQPSNLVAGRVVDDIGEPLSKFTVRAEQIGASSASVAGSVKDRFRDKEGRFEFENLADGSWKLTASASKHGESTAARLQLPDDGGANLELVVPRDASVSGTVTRTDGTASTSGTVRTPSGYTFKTTSIKDDGTFKLKGLAPGLHRISARDEDSAWGPVEEIRLQPGEQRTGIELSTAPAGRIRGVLHASIPEREGKLVTLVTLDWQGHTEATADANGNFVFENLAADNYRVHLSFNSRGGLNREWAEGYAARAEQIVQLAAGEDLEIVLGEPPADEIVIKGTLTMAGKPLENQLVYVFPGKENENIPVTVGYAGDDGKFELRLREPGSYAFTSAPGAQLAFGQVREVSSESPQEMVLELGSASISGTLYGPDGEPRPAHTLMIRRGDAIADSRRPGDMNRATTDENGRFEFMNLEPGRWELRSSGFPNDQLEGVAIRTDLEVEAGEVLDDVELHLRRGGIVRGVCRMADGSPAVGARLYVIYSNGAQMQPWTGFHVEWNGEFQILAVDAGQVEVYAELDERESSHAQVELTEGGEAYADLKFD